MVKASIITIGDELLIGQVIDTNSAWIAQQLNKAGITVSRRVAVGDAEKEIWSALNEESTHADIILITGGLGPTSDDITKPLLCKYFGGKMVVNEEALENVQRLFKEVFKREASPDNLKQAEVPDCCTVVPNKRGTAPGMWFEKDGKIYVSMPGVPYEMQGMISDYVIENLTKRFKVPHIIHKTVLTSGVGESIISQMLSEFEKSLPSDIKLAYLPSYGMVRLRLSSQGENKEVLEESVDGYFKKMIGLVEEFMVVDKDETLAVVVGNTLIKHGKTLGTAESCTGGYISHLLTAIPGSSRYFKGAIVSYDNQVKEGLLHVSSSTLKDYGAVSEETVREMLDGMLKVLKTDYGIAVSGIMGPDGGTETKPVGTVWIAVGSKNLIESKMLKFRFDRMKNIELTAQNALDLLRRLILKEEVSAPV